MLGKIGDLLQQDPIAGEAEDVADPVALHPSHRLGPAVMAVAADQDIDGAPTAADGPHDVAEHEATSVPSGVLPGRRVTATGLPDVAS